MVYTLLGICFTLRKYLKKEGFFPELVERGVSKIKFLKSSNSDVSLKIKSMEEGLRQSFASIKEEFNVHLDSINQNTSEIESLYEYVAEVDSKIEKLNERIDELFMLVSPGSDKEGFGMDLTHREQEVSFILYSEDRVSLKALAKRLGFTEEMVNRYVSSLISKGVPILRQFVGSDLFLYMDLKFKDLQAKRNVLKIDESISKELLKESQI